MEEKNPIFDEMFMHFTMNKSTLLTCVADREFSPDDFVKSFEIKLFTCDRSNIAGIGGLLIDGRAAGYFGCAIKDVIKEYDAIELEKTITPFIDDDGIKFHWRYDNSGTQQAVLIYSFFVERDYQNQGIGSYILEHLTEILKYWIPGGFGIIIADLEEMVYNSDQDEVVGKSLKNIELGLDNEESIIFELSKKWLKSGFEIIPETTILYQRGFPRIIETAGRQG